jgi:transforming growth factor-beta-induced protein
MKHTFSILSVLLIAAFILAACSPAATPMPTAIPTIAPKPTAAPTATPSSIVDIAVADGRFTTLVAALQAAGLVDTLSGEGPFTVFAPTDDAFNKLPAGTVESLLLPENLAKLKDILLYHVVSGKVMASDVVNLTSATTVLGQDITITVKDGKVFLNDGTQVIITDVPASNGVIHVIDTVLLPK